YVNRIGLVSYTGVGNENIVIAVRIRSGEKADGYVVIADRGACQSAIPDGRVVVARTRVGERRIANCDIPVAALKTSECGSPEAIVETATAKLKSVITGSRIVAAALIEIKGDCSSSGVSGTGRVVS